MPNIAVLVPAFNEEKFIKPVLSSLQNALRQQAIQRVLVIDDGSTDRTGALALEAGFEVLRLRKNNGKAFAFAAGVNRLARIPPKILVVVDADLREFHPREISKLVKRLEEKPALRMAVGKVYLQNHLLNFDEQMASGQRAIIFGELAPLIHHKPEWLNAFGIQKSKDNRLRQEEETGYGLELALNEFFAKNESVEDWTRNNRLVSTQFIVARRAGANRQRIFMEMCRTKRRILRWNKLRELSAQIKIIGKRNAQSKPEKKQNQKKRRTK